MKNLQIIGVLTFLIIGTILMSGCTNPGSTSMTPVATPTPQIVYVTVLVTQTPPPTVAITPAPTPIPAIQHNFTNGFWCRDKTINIGKAPTEVTECYQFFSDGTYKWGYSPGRPMGKSQSCSGDPNIKCEYSINSRGQYEVEGGYAFILSGDTLIDPHDPPYFKWSSTGIP
jgi:hypothetical protein